MDITDFIKNLEEEFDTITPNTLKPDTLLRSAVDWNSMNALVLIAAVNNAYDVILNAHDLNKAQTINDLFEIVVEKKAK